MCLHAFFAQVSYNNKVISALKAICGGVKTANEQNNFPEGKLKQYASEELFH